MYSTLYSRDSKGKIRVWSMELDGNKYRTISGLVDGEKVVTEWTVVNGKQNTTPEEQAIIRSNSRLDTSRIFMM